MHGALKLRDSSLLPGLFEPLALRCDGSHTHASWGVRKTHGAWKFDTADEAQYTPLLVQRMVQCVVDQLPPELFERTWKQFRMDALQQTGVQHKHQPSLIPEYATIESLPAIPQSPPCKVLQTPWPAGETDKGGKADKDAAEDDFFQDWFLLFSGRACANCDEATTPCVTIQLGARWIAEKHLYVVHGRGTRHGKEAHCLFTTHAGPEKVAY